ncbi:MAG: hypothetical protein KY476_23435 [Planctomycetes bacterium]|nr:hypothetical protein [Planctomycetota bacterium]
MIERFFEHWLFTAFAGSASIGSAVFAFLAWRRVQHLQERILARRRLPAVVRQLDANWRNLAKAVDTKNFDHIRRELARLDAHLATLADKLPGRRLRSLRSQILQFAARVKQLRQDPHAEVPAVGSLADELKFIIESVHHFLRDQEWRISSAE